MISFAPQPFQDDVVVPSQLKVMVAGVGKDERRPVEVTVRSAFEGRDPGEVWSVSLVRLGATWSVVLNGPTERLRHVSFSAEDYRLAEAIREAIRGPIDSGDPTPSRAAPRAVPRPGESDRVPVQERHVCGRCQNGIVVTYESEPDEPKNLAPIACPHCWEVNRVPIGTWAVEGGDYRAEKA